MSRLIPAAERIQKARQLIEKARQVLVPPGGKYEFSYVAQVKALLQDARNLVKFITKTPSATPELKEQVNRVFIEADQANQELLH